MTFLLQNKAGLTADELATLLTINRNTVRQHLLFLEGAGIVSRGSSAATGGRPKQLYLLTEKGHEYFPRHYSWFAELLISAMEEQLGPKGTSDKLSEMGQKIAQQLLTKYGHRIETSKDKIKILIEVMDEMGFRAWSRVDETGADIIEAENCVFRALASKIPHVCKFDIALIATFSGQSVDHQECMVANGNICRFRLQAQQAKTNGFAVHIPIRAEQD